MKGVFNCAQCSANFERENGQANRSLRKYGRVFCNAQCFGLFYRDNKTTEQRKAEKSLYDKEYRSKNAEKIKARKLEYYFQVKENNPEKLKEHRQKRMPKHIEYCRRPEYRKYKKGYDRQYRTKKIYGEFWEAAINLYELENEIDNRMAQTMKDVDHKSAQRRKRQWQKQQN